MSILYGNGLEAEHLEQFDTSTAVAGIATTDTRGTWSLACLAYVGPGSGDNMAVHSIPTSPSEIYHGYGAKPAGGTFGGAKYENSGGFNQGEVRVASTGFIEIYVGLVLRATSAQAIPLGVWHYFEIHYLCADAGGIIEVKVDGELRVSFSGDTKGTTTSDLSSIKYGTALVRLDDIIVLDTAGAANNTWPGDTGVYRLLPNAAGDVTQLSRGGLDSGFNWSQVEETPPNDITDYVFGSVVDNYDLYNLTPALAQYGSIKGIVAWMRAEKDAAGAASIASMLKSGVTESQGPDKGLTTVWAYYNRIVETDPADGAAWTIADLDALQAGAKVRP